MMRWWLLLVALALLSAESRVSAQAISDPNMRGAVAAAVPPELTLHWSTPDHLLDGSIYTSASEASSVEMRDANGVNRATILLLRTQCTEQNPVGIYPHDYRRCSSIHVRHIAAAKPVTINGGWFHRLETFKRDTHEYAMSFVVQDTPSKYIIDSEILASQYDTKCGGMVFNFQVWSANPNLTETLVNTILSHLASQRPLDFENTAPKVKPVTLLNLARFHSRTLEVVATSTRAIQAQITVVAWIAPNPTPTIEVHNVNLPEGIHIFSLPVSEAAALATEFEIQVHEGGSFLDGVLVAPNHFGGYSSSWIPFSGSGSSIGVRPVGGSPPDPLPGGYSLNDSVVELSCSLVPSSFCGMFIDLLPERSDVLDLSGFDILSLHAVRLDRLGVQRIEVKIETKSGGQYTQFITLEDTWARYTLSLADFVPAQNWSQLAKDVSRIAISAVNMEGSSQTVSSAVGGFAVHRKPVLSLTVLGTGTVTVPEVGLTSDSVGWSAVERGTTLELIATPAERFRFLGWSGDEDCLDGLVSLEDDITCTASFSLENP